MRQSSWSARSTLIICLVAASLSRVGDANPPPALEHARKLLADGQPTEAESMARTLLAQAEAAHGSDTSVLGLRRAFETAGVRTLIMSLWPVKDRAAREWMQGLYEARLVDGLGTAEAVREASLRVLQRRRAAGLSTHPSHWAAFVAAGDWR